MNLLVEELNAHLAGQLNVEGLMEALKRARDELSEHHTDVTSMIVEVPEFLVAQERDQWLETYSKLEQKVSRAEEKVADKEYLSGLAQEVPPLLDELLGLSFGVREAAWAARGPSSHPGANELLHLMEEFVADPNERAAELLMSKLEVEFARFENQAEIYQGLPEFAALAMEQLLPEYKEILEAVSRIEELEEEEEVEQLFAQLEDWAVNYSVYDIDFIVKRYSHVPTPVPAINLALNTQLLLVDGLVTEDMVYYAVDNAVETLQTASQEFLKEQTLSDVDAHAYDEVFNKLLTGLETLPEVEEKEDLKERGGELIDLTSQFVALQKRGETEAGSRLDYKSEG